MREAVTLADPAIVVQARQLEILLYVFVFHFDCDISVSCCF
jgi:hypothetical protein